MPYKSLLRLLMALATGALIGFFTVILLPFLFIFWLTYWLPQEIDAHLSVAKPSPAVRCDGGEEGENIPESILPASIKPALEPVELPPAFEALFKRKDWK